MQQTFEHLLGLPTTTALALLASYGITDISVMPTVAPIRKSGADPMRNDEGEALGYASTRVIAVKDDGHTLIVSRFLVGSPTGGEA